MQQTQCNPCNFGNNFHMSERNRTSLNNLVCPPNRCWDNMVFRDQPTYKVIKLLQGWGPTKNKGKDALPFSDYILFHQKNKSPFFRRESGKFPNILRLSFGIAHTPTSTLLVQHFYSHTFAISFIFL